MNTTTNQASKQQLTVCLSWQESPNRARKKMLVDWPITIGRALENQIVLDNDDVSRSHARLEQENGQLVLIDLGSRNGTLVDGHKIERRTVLEPPTQFQIQPFVFTIEVVSVWVTLAWHDIVTGGRHEYQGPLPITLGSDATNTIILNNDQVKPQHARLKTSCSHQILLVNPDPTQSPVVNKDLTSLARSSNGATFAIGPFTITCRAAPADALSAAHTPAAIKPLSSEQEKQVLQLIENLVPGNSKKIFVKRDKAFVQFGLDYTENRLVCETISLFGGIELSKQEIQALGLAPLDEAVAPTNRQFIVEQNLNFIDKLFRLILG